MKLKSLAILTLCIGTLMSCGDQVNNNNTAGTDIPPPVKTTDPDKIEPVLVGPLFLIGQNQFQGISVGQSISTVKTKVIVTQKRLGREMVNVHKIKSSDGADMGYFIADSEDEKKVGKIVITNPRAETKEGLKIGSTYAELEEKLGDVTISITGMESDVFAIKGSISFLLNVENTRAVLELLEVPSDTKVTEIQLTK